MTFHGTTYSPAIDKARLETALGKVYSLMSDGAWRTLAEIATACGISEAGASARLRDYRKEKVREIYPNGGVARKRLTISGLWAYQLLPAVTPLTRQGLLFDVSKPAERM